MISKGSRANASGETVRRYRCTCCGRNFNERTGTRYGKIRKPKDVFDSVLDSIDSGKTQLRAGADNGVSSVTVRKYIRNSSADTTADSEHTISENVPAYRIIDPAVRPPLH